MRVFSFGVGRTGTLSLKVALERLKFGPCHHMEEATLPERIGQQVPLWCDALDGRPDWPAIYEGFDAACDWPTAAFPRELTAAYPAARFILTTRSPESWADSYLATIAKVLDDRAALPPELQDWAEMVVRVVTRTGFPLGLSREALAAAFKAHEATVRAAAPDGRLLVYQVRDGWGPLCRFLDVPEPDEPFPARNSREEFWESMESDVSRQACAGLS